MPDAKYLELLAQRFPTQQAVFTEIINLQAILNLPRPTEHFLSDVHGEYEAFTHILNNCSGVIRGRVAATFDGVLSEEEQADLCTLIYYPHEKLQMVRAAHADTSDWYVSTLHNLVRIARYLSNGYTRSKVRKAMPVEYAYIIDELLHEAGHRNQSRHDYHVRILESIVETGSTEDFIVSLSALIKRLAVDRLHIVGDLFDRGPHADRILDELVAHHNVDVQWGNHDILWMGAAAGSAACVATVVRNNVRYGQLEILESAYGISLRELALFSEHAYGSADARSMDRAMSVMLLKLEGQVIQRHPEFGMDDRLLLPGVDLAAGVLHTPSGDLPLSVDELPTLDPEDPYALTQGEKDVIEGLVRSFRESRRLRRHVEFLYDNGSVYLVHDGSLLFHGCVPMNPDGTMRMVRCRDAMLSGRAYLDFCDRVARRAWHVRDEADLDWMWYLWCGRLSPMSGREVRTLERVLVADESAWVEARDPYWRLTESEAICREILREFDVTEPDARIINGHTPVKVVEGELPVRGGGRVIVIDGGFCRAYHKTTGIAGFTLVTDDRGMRLQAHRPFRDVAAALAENADIQSHTTTIREEPRPLTVGDTDNGVLIRGQISDLKALLNAYREGDLKEKTVVW